MRIRGWYGESYVPPTTPSVPKKQEKEDQPEKPDQPPDFRDEPPGKKEGLALGRFMPPHRGHQMLVDWGRTWCEHMTVVLASRTGDPIPGALRESWLRELFPDVKLIHLVCSPCSCGASVCLAPVPIGSRRPPRAPAMT